MTELRPLRPQLDRYLRSLPERSDHPEERQDLGTFLTWLLRRSGYTIRLAPFHYDGPKLRVSKGRYQGGVDLVASRSCQGDTEDLFLFVLKRGDIGRAQWRDPAGIVGDLHELGSTLPSDHERWLPKGVDLGRVVVVVGHNGEFDGESLGKLRHTTQERFERDGFAFEWWSAPELVDRALTVLGEGPDDQLFPPTVRPFYGALLDGLHTTGGIAAAAVQRLLKARLPAPAGELHRTLTELSLFAAVIAGQPQVGSTGLLDLLDMLIALVSRCTAALVTDEGKPRAALRETVADLLATFVAAGDQFCRVLSPLAEVRDGLALAAPAEVIDWPLRTVWVLRYLALTIRAAQDLANHQGADRVAAERFAEISSRCLEVSVSLAKHNLGAVATPITDDQLIEYALAWRTWLDHGRTDVVKLVVEQMLSRLIARRYLRLPGPALYQGAATPMADRHARVLAQAWAGAHPPPDFEDGGSTLLPVVLCVASRLGASIDATMIAAFGALAIDGHQRTPVHSQSWSPPGDAAQRWYGEDLSHSGVCHIHQFGDFEASMSRFGELQPHLDPSPASKLGFECIDAMAWVHWRTRPPLVWLLDALPDQLTKGAGATQDPLHFTHEAAASGRVVDHGLGQTVE